MPDLITDDNNAVNLLNAPVPSLNCGKSKKAVMFNCREGMGLYRIAWNYILICFFFPVCQVVIEQKYISE